MREPKKVRTRSELIKSCRGLREHNEKLKRERDIAQAQLEAVRGCQRYIDLGGGSIQESPTGEYLLTRDVLRAIGERDGPQKTS